jgi:hypothetical protein
MNEISFDNKNFNPDFYPQHPLYIVSKGRFQYMITSKVLTKMGVHHYIIVEPQEVKDYQEAINKMKLLATVVPLDMTMKEKYELCDEYGLSKPTGSGPARNFARVHSLANGHTHHWVMDDNIMFFCRLYYNKKIRVYSPAPFRAMEDFSKKYLNVAWSGPQYEFLAPKKAKLKPYILNTRIFSCNFINNSAPFPWRGRYNEDIITSIDILKAGWCTILFNVFLQGKMHTQRLKGGNTDELYHGGPKKGEKYSKTGTIEKSKMLVRVHPDICKVVYRYNRVHHRADLSIFQKTNKLIKNPNWKPPKDPNYGLKLIHLDEE